MMIADSSAIALQFGQTQFGSFIEPVRTAYGGIQSGYYRLGDGTQLFVSRYLPGEQFGKFYLERVPQRCTNVRITGSRPRPDLLPRFLQVVQRAGMQLGPQVDLGEVGFSCTSGSQSLVGSYVAATTLVATNSSRSGMGGAIWTPAYFSGYLTVPEMASEAAKISEAVLGSLSINARWMQQRNAAAQAAVMQDTLRSQQLQAQVLSQIAKTQREVSDTITQGYWQRSRVYDEISRKRENAILGTVDVVNPATGARFKLENSSNFYWMNDQGYKAGTLTHTSPGAGWTEMLVLP